MLKVIQGWKILSVASSLHTPGPNRCRGISGLLQWPEKPTKPGPKLVPKFYKIGPEIFPKSVPKFARKIWACFLTVRKNSQPIFVPLGKNFTTHFGSSICGNFVHFSALVCPLCITSFGVTSHALCGLTGPQRPSQRQSVYNAVGMGWGFTYCNCDNTTQGSTKQ